MTVTAGSLGSKSATCQNSLRWRTDAFDTSSISSPGTLQLSASVVDSVGNPYTIPAKTVNKDTSGWSVQITLPTDSDMATPINAANAASYPVSGTCSSQGGDVTVTVGGASATTIACSSGAWSGNVAVPDTVADADSVAVHANFGTAPNDAAHTVYALKDTAIPTLDITPPPINSHNQGSYSFSGTCTGGHGTVEITVGTINIQADCASDAWEVSGLDVASLTGDSVEMTIDVSDAAGNPANQLGKTVIRDIVPPLVSVTSAPDIGNANKDSYTISGSCDEVDKTVNVAIGSFSRDTTCTADGWSLVLTDTTGIDEGIGLAVVVVLSDDAGNEGRDGDDTITKDTLAPTASLTASAINLASDQSNYPVAGECSEDGHDVVISLNDSGSESATQTVPCGNGGWTAAFNVASFAEGNVTIAVEHEDGVGNTATVEKITIKDLIKPTLSLDSFPDINAASGTQYEIRGGCSELDQKIVVAVSNNNGQSLSIEDGEQPSCGNSGRWSLLVDISNLDDGSITITAGHSDLAGNAANEEQAVVNKDTRFPTLAMDQPGNINFDTDQTSYPVTGSCSEDTRPITLVITDAGGRTVEVSTTCTGSSWPASADTSTLQDGQITFAASYTDQAGNPASDTKNAQRDTQKPVVGIGIANNIDPSNEGSYGLSGTCSEIGEAVTVTLTDADSNSESPDPSPTCAAGGTWAVSGLDVSGLGNGDITIVVSQRDTLQNLGEATGTAVKGDGSVTVSVTSAPNINAAHSGLYWLEGTCSPAGGTVRILPGPYTINCFSPGTWDVSFSSHTAWPQSNNFSFTVGYTHNEVSAEQVIVSIIKDTVAPTASLNTPAEINRINDSAYSLSGGCSEDGREVEITLSDSEATAPASFRHHYLCGNFVAKGTGYNRLARG